MTSSKRAPVACATLSMAPSGPTSITSATRSASPPLPASRTACDVFVTGSEVQRWGLGVVQEIDAAAMHVYARWQHQDIDLDLTGITETVASRWQHAPLDKHHDRPELRRLGSVPGRWHHLLLSQHPERISIGSRPLRGGFFCLSAPTNSVIPAYAGIQSRSLLPECRNMRHRFPLMGGRRGSASAFG